MFFKVKLKILLKVTAHDGVCYPKQAKRNEGLKLCADYALGLPSDPPPPLSQQPKSVRPISLRLQTSLWELMRYLSVCMTMDISEMDRCPCEEWRDEQGSAGNSTIGRW